MEPVAHGTASPAWRAVQVAPALPRGCDWVRASLDSPWGLIEVAAERISRFVKKLRQGQPQLAAAR
jgi:hypothetical protein